MEDEVGDYCAVCAENIDFVAYGRCGHKEVCSNCVVRLRFICKDTKCCICKTESDVVFVTKAVGDYTRRIDFSGLSKEGPYRYHEDSQAYFDDKDHYSEVMDLCKLSCIICEKSEVSDKTSSLSFKNLDQLRMHIFNEHELLMCSWCIEGRKKFIHEQKLFTRDELKRHKNSGDPKAEEGFTGHPECNLCRKRFYGDGELSLHKHTQHFMCNICQRRNPEEDVVYYNEYDDLERHFEKEHYLCGDEACLAKKFVVFLSEYELKRHIAKEHGGAICNRVPTGFRSQPRNNRRRSEDDHDTDDILTRREDFELPQTPIIQPYEFPPLPKATPKRTQEQQPLQKVGNTMAGRLHGKFTSPSSFPTLAANLACSTSNGASSTSQSTSSFQTLAASFACSEPAVSEPPASSSKTRSWLAPGKPTTRSFRPSGKKATGPTKEDIQNARRSSALEKIRAGLGSDDEKFAEFTKISSEYNMGAKNADEYLEYVENAGLSNLVVELAWLCSDDNQKRTLLGTCNANQKGKN